MPQRLGQHFLKNTSALRLIVKTLNPQDDETVIEIGPGHGELTEFLQIANRKSQMVLIEKDKNLYGALKEKFKDDSRITITEGDALEQLSLIVAQLSNSSVANYNIVGNIPYYITGHLFRVISELDHSPKRCVFTIQKEVAERICAEPPKMNRLAASVQYWATPSIVKILPASDFNPKPKVASAIIVL
jgi:16S rRNA (adenine1518-N6/adenine1519-N6)-dimethyltransferase